MVRARAEETRLRRAGRFNSTSETRLTNGLPPIRLFGLRMEVQRSL